ncbi:Os01g0189700, partial [Oryza sativa Japonica Group]
CEVYQCAVYHICLTPFMACAESGDVPTVKYFLDHGGDVTKSDDKGCTQFSTMLLAQIPLNIQFILIYITNCIVVQGSIILQYY